MNALSRLFAFNCIAFLWIGIPAGLTVTATATATATGVVDSALVGRYTKAEDPKQYFDLRADSTFTIDQGGGEGMSGDCSVSGGTVTCHVPGGRGLVLVIAGGSFTGPDKAVWHKVPGAVPEPPPAGLPNLIGKSGGAASPVVGGNSTGAGDGAAMQERGKVTLSINHVKQLLIGCKLWAADHNGSFPEKALELFTDKYLGAGKEELLKCPIFGYEHFYGYYYNGSRLSDTSPGNKIVFLSHWIGADGKRIVGHVDGSAVLEVPKREDYPDPKPGTATPPNPSAPPAANTVSIPPGVLRSLVIVAGESALGSGFFVRLKGHTYVVTNSHVIRGQSDLTFTNMSNQVVQHGPLEIAGAADLVRSEVSAGDDALEAEDKIESLVKIGDAVIVAGNSEGAGVVRGIPGKVVGIGPDRIEVDAPFVPGNSGSPIVLQSTGRVIGVATYLLIPKSPGKTGRAEDAMALHEVRRFGYRLDTVADWVAHPQPAHLLKEGTKLNQIKEAIALVSAIFTAGPAALSKSGAGFYITSKQTAENPSLALLRAALEEFSVRYKSADKPEDKKRCLENLVKAMIATISAEMSGLLPEHFSGYFSSQFTRYRDEVKELQDWLGANAVLVWTGNGNANRSSSSTASTAPPRKGAELLTISYHYAPKLKPENRHKILLEKKEMPADKASYTWVVDPPSHQLETTPLTLAMWHLRPAASGTYKVFLEYHSGTEKRPASNVLEVSVP